MNHIVASIQVRMGSSRFPGKVMFDVAGKPLLGHLISRLRWANLLDDIVVATSTNPENDIIETFCKNGNISCFRGDENDVLGRTLGALQFMNATIGVEVFGDCPLIDPAVVDFIIEKFINDIDEPDFVSNDLKTTFPPGMEVEVFNVDALKDASKRTNDPVIREHGTLFIRQNQLIYKVVNVVAPKKWYRPELELEVDTEEDIYVVTKIFEYFSTKKNENFGIEEIIKFMDANTDIKNKNINVPRHWKVFRGENNV